MTRLVGVFAFSGYRGEREGEPRAGSSEAKLLGPEAVWVN